MGNFRLLVHASCLLGRVIQHISDKDVQERFLAERTLQLYRTTRALLKVYEVESRTGLVSVSLPRNILYR